MKLLLVMKFDKGNVLYGSGICDVNDTCEGSDVPVCRWL